MAKRRDAGLSEACSNLLSDNLKVRLQLSSVYVRKMMWVKVLAKAASVS